MGAFKQLSIPHQRDTQYLVYRRGNVIRFQRAPSPFSTPKTRAIYHIEAARDALEDGHLLLARFHLKLYRRIHDNAPASTKRRWRCGR